MRTLRDGAFEWSAATWVAYGCVIRQRKLAVAVFGESDEWVEQQMPDIDLSFEAYVIAFGFVLGCTIIAAAIFFKR